MSKLIASLNPVAEIFGPAEILGNKFLNPVPTSVMGPGRAGRMMRRLLLERRHGDPNHALGPFRTDTSIYAAPPVRGLRVTWMGHSSLLIEIDGVRILTDPVWSERASFVSFAGPRRFYPPTLALKDLPPLDAVLISHDHYDHLDRETIEQLAALLKDERTRFICSLGLRQYLESWGIAPRKITELNWGQTAGVGRECQITATPARHFSGRGLWGRNETLWSSFVIRGSEHNIFFGADSGMFPGFRPIGDAYGPFDLTMLEIGAYDADWPDVHMGPIHAAQAHVDLQGKLLLPIHWGLFNLAFHPWREPIERLMVAAAEKNLQLFLPSPGSPTEVTGANLHTYWWEL
jgi:L-ascorbate metabolism protein UlaG (beta-lactamase superfamily)